MMGRYSMMTGDPTAVPHQQRMNPAPEPHWPSHKIEMALWTPPNMNQGRKKHQKQQQEANGWPVSHTTRDEPFQPSHTQVRQWETAITSNWNKNTIMGMKIYELKRPATRKGHLYEEKKNVHLVQEKNIPTEGSPKSQWSSQDYLFKLSFILAISFHWFDSCWLKRSSWRMILSLGVE